MKLISKLARFFSVTIISSIVVSQPCRADIMVENFSDIQYWVGTGSKQAALVVDWNDGVAPESYVWGYRWDGTATGEDMVRAIDTADVNLTIGLQFFSGFGYSFASAGYDSDGDGGNDHFADGTSFTDGYWSLWAQETSSPFASGAWSFSDIGMTDRILSDGSWDGWSWAPGFSEPGDNGPDTGIAAVPEPGSMALLLVSGSTLLIACRKRLYRNDARKA